MKRKFFIVLLFLILGFFIFFFLGCKKQKPHFVIENNEIYEIFGKKKIQLTKDGFEKSDLKISPDGKKIGYLKHLFSKSIFSPESKEYWENYFTLMSYDLQNKKEEEILKTDYHLFGWEWIFPDEIAICINCGTECQLLKIIDLKTKKETNLNFGVNYEWSPDKKYVLAYNFASGFYGITIGDRFGNIVFTLKRKLPDFPSHLVEKTKANWSRDGKKLTLIIKKENEEKLEILVFDVKKNFKIISKRDAEHE
jgi:dipeptidyl aminopeptidase/acylaminoacyl peptidase